MNELFKFKPTPAKFTTEKPKKRGRPKKWPKISDAEIKRLEQRLATHLRSMGISKTKEERHDFVMNILKLQKGTCAFADGDDRYCWNHPKNSHLDYLKLEWGHKKPISRTKYQYEDQLYLLCARCNNHLQSSRTLHEVINELEHKLKALKKIRG